MTWRIFSVFPSRDFHAAAEIAERGWSAYVPAETVWAGPAKNRRPTKRPIIGGYVFAELTDEQAGDVCRLSEVAALIWPKGYEQELVSVALAGFIEGLKAEERAGAFDRTRRGEKRFAAGDRVRIARGAFSGYLATISELKGKRKAQVLLPFSVSNGAPLVIDTAKLEHEVAA